jgi:hypothetical protein
MAQVGSFTLAVTQIGNGLTKYSIAWTASAGGAVSGASFQMMTGRIYQVKFVPGNGGTAPSNDYGATLLDADGVDLLAGKGTSLSSSAASVVAPVVSSVAPEIINDGSIGSPAGSVTPTISAAGNAGQGRIDLIVGP